VNVLPQETINELHLMFREGRSVREIAKKLRIAKGTVLRYRATAGLPEKCRCGQRYGHRGWCCERYARSLVRQFTLHPEKFIGILDRLPELWAAMPQEHKDIAVRLHGEAMFSELTLKTKLSLIECGWGWVQRVLTEEAEQHKFKEEMKWLKESRKLMKQVRQLARENG